MRITLSLVKTIILAVADILGWISEEAVSKAMTTGYVVTPELTDPAASILYTFPVNVFSERASIFIVALSPILIFGISISDKFTVKSSGASVVTLAIFVPLDCVVVVEVELVD